ncbi:MAG: DUF3090 family protein [bacterium]|jgi:uncharacterized repeat protein (TIGR03847 family)|nr:DUF3090 family protein [bacterium]
MADAEYEFNEIDAIDAESFGEPGKRTFRVRVRRHSEVASLWVEKQQLAALGDAIPRLIEELTTPDQHPNEVVGSIGYFPEEPGIEFKVGRLALGYATDEDRLVLMVHAIPEESEEEEDVETSTPTFMCRFTREQARQLSDSCTNAVEGGRPLCVVCHRPIDPEGHFCPRSNGHQKLQL